MLYLMRTSNHESSVTVDIVAKTPERKDRVSIMSKFKFCKKIDIFISWKVECKKTYSVSHSNDACVVETWNLCNN